MWPLRAQEMYLLVLEAHVTIEHMLQLTHHVTLEHMLQLTHHFCQVRKQCCWVTKPASSTFYSAVLSLLRFPLLPKKAFLQTNI